MKHILFFVVLFGVVYLLHETNAGPELETSIYGTKYLITFEKKNWISAYTVCKQRRMELISINTEEQFDNALLLIKRTGETNVTYWTSGTDIFNENNFIWVSTGQAFDYAPWHDNQPDNLNNKEDCVELKNYKNVFKLNDSNCVAKNYFICSSNDIDIDCNVQN